MNFQHLRHFVVTADTGNMLKAAEALNISQSGLSRSVGALENMLGLPLFERSVGALENMLGLPLFERSAKGVQLTAFGQRFYPHARLMLNDYKRSMDELKTFQNLQGGSLRFGINNSFAFFLIPGVVSELVRRWPGIHIDVVSDNYSALVTDLTLGNIDIALSLYTAGSLNESLEYEPLFEIRTRVIARTDHPLRGVEALGPEHLISADWALINGNSVRSAFEAYFVERGIEAPQVSMQCSSVTLLASVVAQSDLVTLLPEELIPKTSAFAIEPIGETVFGVAQVGLIRRRGSFDSPIAERFSRLLRRDVAGLGLPGRREAA